MSHGLAVRVSSGELTIDGQHANYGEWGSGSVTVQDYASAPTITFPSAAPRMPLIFVQCTSPVFLVDTVKSGASFVGAKIATFTGTLAPSWPSGFVASCPYRLFMPLSFLGSSFESHGLRLFGPSGDVVFDSGRTYMQPKAYHVYTRPAGWPGGVVGVEQQYPISGFSATPWVCINPFSGPLKYDIPITPALRAGYTEGVRAVSASALGYLVGGSMLLAGAAAGALVPTGVSLPLIAIP